MYFAVIGNHEDIHLHALSYLHPSGLTTYKKHIVFFESDYPERFSHCAGMIKRGYLTDDGGLAQAVQDAKIIAVHGNDLGRELKKRFDHIKKYKVIDILHTDAEIKEHGTEILSFGTEGRGIITGYQAINMYETIDFDKPCRGMEVGMMPAKLALGLINIAIGEYEEVISHKGEVLSGDTKNGKEKELITYNSTLKTPPTVWDPFVGFGTTSFLSHTLGYPSIASDINITNIKNNLSRREDTRNKLVHDETNKVPLTIRKHDVTKPFDDPVFAYADCIVSEGYLGHVVTHRTHSSAIRQGAEEVLNLYNDFITNITILNKNHPKTCIIVITIPVWIHHDYSISERVKDSFINQGRDTELITDIYSRPRQMVGRQILIAKKE